MCSDQYTYIRTYVHTQQQQQQGTRHVDSISASLFSSQISAASEQGRRIIQHNTTNISSRASREEFRTGLAGGSWSLFFSFLNPLYRNFGFIMSKHKKNQPTNQPTTRCMQTRSLFFFCERSREGFPGGFLNGIPIERKGRDSFRSEQGSLYKHVFRNSIARTLIQASHAHMKRIRHWVRLVSISLH